MNSDTARGPPRLLNNYGTRKIDVASVDCRKEAVVRLWPYHLFLGLPRIVTKMRVGLLSE